MDARTERVCEFLRWHLADDVTLAQLASIAGLSRCHLIRVFRAQHGVTPFAYQRSLRIERARQILAGGGSVATAVSEGGFADQSHLGRRFRLVFGDSPSHYRRGAVTRARAARAAPSSRRDPRR